MVSEKLCYKVHLFLFHTLFVFVQHFKKTLKLWVLFLHFPISSPQGILPYVTISLTVRGRGSFDSPEAKWLLSTAKQGR